MALNASVSPSFPPRPRRGVINGAVKRQLAKAGIAASLGVLMWSAMAGRRLLRRYHAPAGVALLGFGAWHMSLYRPRGPAAPARHPR